jgi:hypothetical protein
VIDQLAALISENADEIESRSILIANYEFDRVVNLEGGGRPFPVTGLLITAELDIEWMAKTLDVIPDLGRHNVQAEMTTLPGGFSVIFAGLDEEGWESVDPPTQMERRSGDLPIISIRALLQARLERAQGGSPDVSALVKRCVGLDLDR